VVVAQATEKAQVLNSTHLSRFSSLVFGFKFSN
jgi:hypothetical protein